jgi:predicted RNA-binding protein with PUA-like domain
MAPKKAPKKDTKKVTKTAPKKGPTKTSKAKIESEVSLEYSPDPIKPAAKSPPQFPVDPKNNNVRYWLIKSEPFSRIDPATDIDVAFPFSELLEVEREEWSGVRNHEAKNNMLNMKHGDILLFYHSNTRIPGIVGLAKVEGEAHPDSTQFEPRGNYYDAKSTEQNPRWWCVDVKFSRRFRSKVTLQELRDNPNLEEMLLVKRGRLSVTPVRSEEYYEILKMEKAKPVSDDIDCEVSTEYLEEVYKK